MGQMSNEEAARILDPETSREALAPYPHDYQLILAVTEEACTVAAKVLRDTAWISVKDRRPDNMNEVLLAVEIAGLPRIRVGWYGGGRWYFLGAGRAKAVTHWMPLPEPPKED